MDDFMEKMQELVEIYKNPHNKKALENYDYWFKDTNIPCGDEVEVFIEVEGNKVKNASFLGKGCLVSQVSASLLLEHIKEKDLKEIMSLDDKDIKRLLDIELSPTRMKCANLSLRVVKQALSISFILAKHESPEGTILGIVDKSIMGKTYEEGNLVLDLSKDFYKGKEATLKEIKDSIDKCYTANIVGNNIVKALIKMGVVHKENVKEIKGVKYIHIYKL